ncbi:3D domain-containing protein [Clostridium chromiireducens]|uniref:3D domain-containing protein n=1 Tax=Clostridium chromiireducens TaxID=225345 RepID=UPI003AF4299B
MLRVKMLMCSLSFIILFNTYSMSTITPFNALATDVVDEKNIKPLNNDEIQENENPLKNLQTEKMELSKLITQKESENEINKKPEEAEKNEPEWKEFILTFYTSLNSENSSAGPVTCQNKPLTHGGVANNVIPQNTNIYLEGYGQVTVNDRGSDKYFGVDNRLDVFIEREPGESDRQYYQRVNSYGVQKVNGYIVK